MPRGAFRSSLLLVGTLGIADASTEASGPPHSLELRHPADLEAIVAVARRWAEAWHTGDQEGMAACLHPDLDHRILHAVAGDGGAIEAVPNLLGVQARLGRSVNPAARKTEVGVLDVHGRSASARVDLGPWCAFIHLAAHRGGWGIASVLWEWQGSQPA
jgi:hypothetical protein